MPIRILTFGNCQAQILAEAMQIAANIAKGKHNLDIEIRHLPNYLPPDKEGRRIPGDLADFAAKADFVYRQVDQRADDPLAGYVPAGARIIRFPAVRANFLWPFATRPHPLHDTVVRIDYLRPNVYPMRLGDALVNRLMARLSKPEEILDAILDTDIPSRVDLDRLLELTAEKLRGLEADCEIRIWDFIERNFRRERLFWAVDHPAWSVFAPMCEAAITLGPFGLDEDEMAFVLRRKGATNPLSQWQAPLHVTVIRHFKLRWCDASTRYRIGSEGRFTYPGHVLRYTGFVHDAELYRGQFLTTRDAASWAEGETLLRNALSRNPCNGEISFALARNLARQDRHAEALPFANAAARDADAMGEPELQALRGAILDRIGRADDAAAALRLAAALSDDPARHFASLGRLHRKQGDHRKAVEAFQEAVASDPYDRRHAADLAAAAPSPSGKPSRSDPEPAEASLRRARALEAAGNADAALEAARHAVRLDPDHREAWQLIGRVAIKLWRLDDAEAAQRQLIRLDDADWHAWFSLAFALCRAKRFAEAEAAASRAIRLKTSDPFLHHVRGIALEQLGRLEEAEADVRQALELAPDTRLFQQQLATLKRQAASA